MEREATHTHTHTHTQGEVIHRFGVILPWAPACACAGTWLRQGTAAQGLGCAKGLASRGTAAPRDDCTHNPQPKTQNLKPVTCNL